MKKNLITERRVSEKESGTKAILWKANLRTERRVSEKESRTKAILWKANLRTERRVFEKDSRTKAKLCQKSWGRNGVCGRSQESAHVERKRNWWTQRWISFSERLSEEIQKRIWGNKRRKIKQKVWRARQDPQWD